MMRSSSYQRPNVLVQLGFRAANTVFPFDGELSDALKNAVAKSLMKQQLEGSERSSHASDLPCTDLMARAGKAMSWAWSAWHVTQGQEEPYNPQLARDLLLSDPLFETFPSPHNRSIMLISLDAASLLDAAIAGGCSITSEGATALAAALGTSSTPTPPPPPPPPRPHPRPAFDADNALSPAGTSLFMQCLPKIWPDDAGMRTAAEILLGMPSKRLAKAELGRELGARLGIGEEQQRRLVGGLVFRDHHFRVPEDTCSGVMLDLVALLATVDSIIEAETRDEVAQAAATAAEDEPAAPPGPPPGLCAAGGGGTQQGWQDAGGWAAANGWTEPGTPTSSVDAPLHSASTTTAGTASHSRLQQELRSPTYSAPSTSSAAEQPGASRRLSPDPRSLDPLPPLGPLRALLNIWPGQHPSDRIFRLAAALLLAAPGMSLSSEQLGKLLQQGAPDLWDVQSTAWQKPGLRQLLSQDQHFRCTPVPGTAPPRCIVALEVALLRRSLAAAAPQRQAHRQQLEQLQALLQRVTEAEGAAAGTEPSEDAEGLLMPVPLLELEQHPELQQLEQQCRAASVKALAAPDTFQLLGLLGHLQQCGQLGLALATGQGGRIALVKIMAPAAELSCAAGPALVLPAALYLLDLAAAGEAAARQLLAHLQPLLESESVTKVVHGAHQVCAALQAQYSIRLAGVFDTQVAAGVAALAAAGSAASGTTCRVSLQQLQRQHGYGSSSRQQQERSPGPRQVLQVQHAVDDVRYLLPIAARLRLELATAAERMVRHMSCARAHSAEAGSSSNGSSSDVRPGQWLLQLLQ